MSQDTGNPLAELIRKLIGIRPDELKVTVVSFSFVFLLMFAYNILKPVRDALAPEWTDVELASLWTINFVFSAIAVSVYGFAVSRMSLKRVIPAVYGLFAVSFVLFYVGAQVSGDAAIINKAFYVWVSLFSLFHISVFWSLMADLFSKDQAPRLFAFIASGASVGSIAGAAATLFLATRLGALNLMLIAAAMLVAIVPLVTYLRSLATGTESDDVSISGNPFAGFKELVTNPYLLGIAFFIFLYTFIGSFAYFELKNLMTENGRDTNTAFWAGINLWVNFISIGTAWFVTSRITSLVGVGRSLALVPLLVAVVLVLLFVNPLLSMVIVAWVVLKAGNYSITRPGREMLYTNVSREDRFKTKQVIDIVVYRGGDVISGWAFALLTTSFGLGLGPIAIVGAGVALLWAFVGLRLGTNFDRARAAQGDQD